MTIPKVPLTNLQLALLELYSHEVSEQDLIEIKHLIGLYFAKRLTSIADEAWMKYDWSDENMDAILNDDKQ
jgi:hypothetical protein